MNADGAIAIVVVTHYSAATLDECLAAVLTADTVAELLVVDNATADGSVDEVLRRFEHDPRVRIVRNTTNRGFASGCNQGAAATRPPWLVFLNPDCIVERDTFARMQSLARARPGVGLVGADVRGEDGVPERAARRREPTWRRSLKRVFGDRNAFALARTDRDAEATAVDATSGALMLIERAVFERLGGFDEAYRLHCEDLDLCRRVRDAGLAVVVAERARATHRQGSSSRRRPLFVGFHKHRGMHRYFRKHERAGVPPPLAWLIEAGIWARFALLAPWLALRELAARLR